MSDSILDVPAPRAGERLPYGAGPYHFGDLRFPRRPGPHPVAIVIHGGFWRARYDLEHIGHLCAALTSAGLATWSLEYRRLGNPGGGWPGTFLDVGAGADFLRQLARPYALDLDRVVAVGHSAGGHLAAWLAGRHRIAAENPLHVENPLPLRGVVPLAGVLDLSRAYELRLSAGVTGELMGGSPGEHPNRYAAASPVALLPLGAPQILVHGTADDTVPYDISRDYAAEARAAGDDAELVTLSGAGHFELIDPRSAEWPEVERAMLRLLA